MGITAATLVLVGVYLSTCHASSSASLLASRRLSPGAILPADGKAFFPPIRLRGGDDTCMAEGAEKDPKSWGEDDVLVFVQGLREKLGAKTDEYVELFRYPVPNSAPLGDV
jgi:hypothetical protein